jgi:hypothetical protein
LLVSILAFMFIFNFGFKRINRRTKEKVWKAIITIFIFLRLTTEER